MTLQELIADYAGEFETRTVKRCGEEKTITVFADGASEELRHAVFKAHGDRLPNDWIFDKFNEILNTLGDYAVETIEDIENVRHEVVDSLVDVYTCNLTAWLNDETYNVEYLDEAVNEYGATENILAVAQDIAIDEIFSAVLDFITIQWEAERK